MIKGGVAVAQEKAPPLRSFLLSPSNHLRHRSLCQPASQPSGQEMLCQLIHLTVKDISFEDGKPTSQLAFKDLGKSHVFGGLPRSNMALTGLKWCASGNVMASGTKSSEGRRKIYHDKAKSTQTDTLHIPAAKNNSEQNKQRNYGIRYD